MRLMKYFYGATLAVGIALTPSSAVPHDRHKDPPSEELLRCDRNKVVDEMALYHEAAKLVEHASDVDLGYSHIVFIDKKTTPPTRFMAVGTNEFEEYSLSVRSPTVDFTTTKFYVGCPEELGIEDYQEFDPSTGKRTYDYPEDDASKKSLEVRPKAKAILEDFIQRLNL